MVVVVVVMVVVVMGDGSDGGGGADGGGNCGGDGGGGVSFAWLDAVVVPQEAHSFFQALYFPPVLACFGLP